MPPRGRRAEDDLMTMAVSWEEREKQREAVVRSPQGRKAEEPSGVPCFTSVLVVKPGGARIAADLGPAQPPLPPPGPVLLVTIHLARCQSRDGTPPGRDSIQPRVAVPVVPLCCTCWTCWPVMHTMHTRAKAFSK